MTSGTKLLLWVLALIGLTLLQAGLFVVRGVITNEVWLLV
jgi:hypothetical protein